MSRPIHNWLPLSVSSCDECPLNDHWMCVAANRMVGLLIEEDRPEWCPLNVGAVIITAASASQTHGECEGAQPSTPDRQQDG